MADDKITALVKQLQIALRDNGKNPGAIDGWLGKGTIAAYNAWRGAPGIIASSFADPADVRGYLKAKAEGMSDKEAFKHGDNGLGAWGMKTAVTDRCICALPPEVWKEKWGTGQNANGKRVVVRWQGKEVEGVLGDTMPPIDLAHKQNGAGIDLNPGFAKAFGITPPFLIDGVTWSWLD